MSRITPILMVLLLFVGVTSCKKKCKLSDDTETGNMVKNVVFYTKYVAWAAGTQGATLNSNAGYGDIDVSIDGGSRTAVNYNNYTVLLITPAAKCNSQFDKTVTIDHANMKVTYDLVVTQCSNCTDIVNSDQYVLVPKFPASYTVVFNTTYVDK